MTAPAALAVRDRIARRLEARYDCPVGCAHCAKTADILAATSPLIPRQKEAR